MAQEQQQVEISCGKGARTYATLVTVQNLDFFLEAAKRPGVIGKSGEALVSALLAVAKGAITKVERIKDDKLNDGRNGEPAYQVFNDAGTLVHAARWKAGWLNDGPDGEPAVQYFNADRPNGAPAIQDFNIAATLEHAARWKAGRFVKQLTAEEISGAAAVRVIFGDRLKLRPSP